MKKFLKDESGATAIEYGLIAAAMGTCLILVMPFITDALTTKFTFIGSEIAK
jgi:pilus assembly protein Flp/PilA